MITPSGGEIFALAGDENNSAEAGVYVPERGGNPTHPPGESQPEPTQRTVATGGAEPSVMPAGGPAPVLCHFTVGWILKWLLMG